MNRLKSQLNYLHVLTDAKTQARRALLTSANDEIIKVTFECAINTLNGNLKLSTEEKNKLSKYKGMLRALVNPKFSFKSRRKFYSKRWIYSSFAD
jgi:hypothetical protein